MPAATPLIAQSTTTARFVGVLWELKRKTKTASTNANTQNDDQYPMDSRARSKKAARSGLSKLNSAIRINPNEEAK